jgi:hypothetical protein
LLLLLLLWSLESESLKGLDTSYINEAQTILIRLGVINTRAGRSACGSSGGARAAARECASLVDGRFDFRLGLRFRSCFGVCCNTTTTTSAGCGCVNERVCGSLYTRLSRTRRAWECGARHR